METRSCEYNGIHVATYFQMKRILVTTEFIDKFSFHAVSVFQHDFHNAFLFIYVRILISKPIWVFNKRKKTHFYLNKYGKKKIDFFEEKVHSRKKKIFFPLCYHLKM